MIQTYPALGSLAAEWNELAREAGSPFLTHEWLDCWWSAFGHGDPIWMVLRDGGGALRAGACLQRRRGGGLASAANVHSADWDVLARDESARREMWAAIVRMGGNRIELQGMPAREDGSEYLCGALTAAGYRVLHVLGPMSPWLALPSSWDELIGAASSGLRAQVGRRRRGLERQGSLRFRVVGAGASLDQDLDTFLRLEASGWKAKRGTAILSDSSTERLYREFARVAAKEGWLRMYFLDLDGETIAADYGCAYEGHAFFMKTGFDEAHSRLSPGLVLRAEVLRSSIEEGLRSYDFMGEADLYKTRWTSAVQPRAQVFAYRGAARLGYTYRKSLRPMLKSLRDRAVERRSRKDQRSPEPAQR
jgi:CelD/BcsL family acetyltransferase involved in cellulose biosynthesis